MHEMNQRIEVYYDHYKDTFKDLKSYLKKRDRVTLYLVAMLAIVMFISYDAPDFAQKFNEILIEKFKLSSVSFQLINTAFILALLFVALTYFQICLHIERSYKYLANVEYTLSELTGMNIDRESKSYLSNYPLVSDFAHFIYTYVLPIVTIGVAVTKFWQEYKIPSDTFFILDSIILGAIVLVSLVYIVDRILLNANIRWIDMWYSIKELRLLKKIGVFCYENARDVICVVMYFILAGLMIWVIVHCK